MLRRFPAPILVLFVVISLTLHCQIPQDPADPSNTTVELLIRNSHWLESNLSITDTVDKPLQIGVVITLPENIDSIRLSVKAEGKSLFDTLFQSFSSGNKDTIWKAMSFADTGDKFVSIVPYSKVIKLSPVSAGITIANKTSTIQSVNHPPKWTAKEITEEVAKGLVYTLRLDDNCKDADGDSIQYVLQSGKGIITNDVFTFTASGADTALNKVIIIASDTRLSDTLTLTIIVKATDEKPPVLLIKSGPVNDTRVFSPNGRIGLSVIDPSGISSVSFALNGISSQLVADSTGNCILDFTQLKSGNNKLVVTAIDNSVNKNKDSLVVNVRYNVLPDITLISPVNGADAILKNVTFEWAGTDRENDSLQYSLYAGKTTATMEQLYKGPLTKYSITTVSATNYVWKVKAFDSQDTGVESAVRSFTTNAPPGINLLQPGTSSGNVSQSVNLVWEGTDKDVADAGKLKYSVLLDTLPDPKNKIAETPAQSVMAEQLLQGKKYYWKVIATDSKDSTVSSIFDFTTGNPAKIVVQPKDDTLNVPGGNAAFTVTADGYGSALRYQWLENGNIRQGDTTATLTIQKGVHNSKFTCIVSNGIGKADTSLPAQLKIAYLVKTKNIGSGAGTIVPSDPFVMEGSDQVFTIEPSARSVVAKLFKGKNKIDVNTVCTLKTVTSPDSIQVMFFNVPELMKPIPSKNAEFMMKKLTYDNSFEGEHSVSFTSDFYIDSTELTQKDYTHYMRLSPWNEFEAVAKGDEYPAVAVSFSSAILFCNAKSKSMGLDTVYKYNGITGSGMIYDPLKLEGLETDYSNIGFRLPTEAEWEFAYRAKNYSNDYYWGRNINVNCIDSQVMNLYGWSNYNLQKNEDGLMIYAAKKVATKLCNQYGVYDMAGNVWEYTNDWFSDSILYKNKVINPIGNIIEQPWKVIKGGSYGSDCIDLCVHRISAYEQWGAVDLGFRTVLQNERLISINKMQ